MGYVKHKFNAKPTTVNNIRFASKKEAAYYQHLIKEVEKGSIIFFLRQVPIHLGDNVKYVVDFLEFHSDNTVHFRETKGLKTPLYITKKKLVEEKYPITIEEV